MNGCNLAKYRFQCFTKNTAYKSLDPQSEFAVRIKPSGTNVTDMAYELSISPLVGFSAGDGSMYQPSSTITLQMFAYGTLAGNSNVFWPLTTRRCP